MKLLLKFPFTFHICPLERLCATFVRNISFIPFLLQHFLVDIPIAIIMRTGTSIMRKTTIVTTVMTSNS